MKKNYIVFKALGTGKRAPCGYKNIDVHLVWDLNIDFTSKSRLVDNGNLFNPPLSMSYGLVVSRDIFCLYLLISALNN